MHLEPAFTEDIGVLINGGRVEAASCPERLRVGTSPPALRRGHRRGIRGRVRRPGADARRFEGASGHAPSRPKPGFVGAALCRRLPAPPERVEPGSLASGGRSSDQPRHTARGERALVPFPLREFRTGRSRFGPMGGMGKLCLPMFCGPLVTPPKGKQVCPCHPVCETGSLETARVMQKRSTDGRMLFLMADG